MGVYIKGMEMPVIELEWTIRRGSDGKWYAIDTNAETSDGEWHEIVHVPPHGRLIDADAELKKLNRICLPDDLSYTIGHDIAKQFLNDAPTIIPASEEGET